MYSLLYTYIYLYICMYTLIFMYRITSEIESSISLEFREFRVSSPRLADDCWTGNSEVLY